MIKKEFIISIVIVSNFVNLLAMSPEIMQKIGGQIWQNEASGREDLLVFWNEKESFPSLGIGHNIWFPEGHEIKYTQGFPLLCDYLKKSGIQWPPWVEDALPKGAPWKNREEFYQDQERITELRQLLVATIPLQTKFMYDHLIQKIPKLILEAPIAQREKITQHINLLLTSALGTYILVDYLNFKGDGLNQKEESNGQRWGLLSVLIGMPENLTPDNVNKAFIVSAAKKLLMLIEHSAPDYRRVAFLPGWMNRLSTYNKSSIFSSSAPQIILPKQE
jgi:hypothetical protein